MSLPWFPALFLLNLVNSHPTLHVAVSPNTVGTSHKWHSQCGNLGDLTNGVPRRYKNWAVFLSSIYQCRFLCKTENQFCIERLFYSFRYVPVTLSICLELVALGYGLLHTCAWSCSSCCVQNSVRKWGGTSISCIILPISSFMDLHSSSLNSLSRTKNPFSRNCT